jgi:WD40 repeat protein
MIRRSIPCLRLVLVLGAGVLAPSPAQPEPPSLRTDRHGDPLPPGAVARLGSLQLRHYGLSNPDGSTDGNLVFTPDSKTLITAGWDRTIRFWDVSSGRQKHAVKLQGTTRTGSNLTLSADGALLLDYDVDVLRVWDTATGKLIKRWAGQRNAGPWSRIRLSPDGRTLALLSARARSRVVLWDWKAEQERVLHAPTPSQANEVEDGRDYLSFSLDGKWLLSKSATGPQLLVWEVSAGRLQQRLRVLVRFAGFSPDSNYLLLATVRDLTAPQARLRIYEVASGNLAHTFELPGRQVFHGLACAPDGQTLVELGSEGLTVFDRQTGRSAQRWATAGAAELQAIQFSPDGKMVAGVEGQGVRLWDVATGKELHPRAGHSAAVTRLSPAPEGRLWSTSEAAGSELELWEWKTGRPLGSWRGDLGLADGRYLGFSEGGKKLLIGNDTGRRLLVDLADGKPRRSRALQEVEEVNLLANLEDVHSVYLTANRRRLLTLQRDDDSPYRDRKIILSIWDLKPTHLAGRRSFGVSSRGEWVELGERVAVLTMEGIAVVDSPSTKFRVQVPLHGRYEHLGVSPDHRLLAAAYHEPGQPRVVRVWEVAGGSSIATVLTGPVDHLALGPGDRTLVTVGPLGLHMWDLASGQEWQRIPFPEDFVRVRGEPFVKGLLLTPDGRHAVTGLGDGTLLVWQLAEAPRRERQDLAFADLWDQLAAADAAKVYAALWQFADGGEAAVAFLSKQVTPATNRIGELLQELDHKRFSVRQSAARELERMGPDVVPALLAAQDDSWSLEVRRRVEALVEVCSQGKPSAAFLREQRAVQILELIATPAARRELEALAHGAALAPLTREAQAALERLAMRNP